MTFSPMSWFWTVDLKTDWIQELKVTAHALPCFHINCFERSISPKSIHPRYIGHTPKSTSSQSRNGTRLTRLRHGVLRCQRTLNTNRNQLSPSPWKFASNIQTCAPGFTQVLQRKHQLTDPALCSLWLPRSETVHWS
jgi:hypothetical protein